MPSPLLITETWDAPSKTSSLAIEAVGAPVVLLSCYRGVVTSDARPEPIASALDSMLEVRDAVEAWTQRLERDFAPLPPFPPQAWLMAVSLEPKAVILEGVVEDVPFVLSWQQPPGMVIFSPREAIVFPWYSWQRWVAMHRHFFTLVQARV